MLFLSIRPQGEFMKALSAAVVAGVLAAVAAGCGSAGQPTAAKPAVTVTVTTGAQSSHSGPPGNSPPPSNSQATANERKFADAMAESSITVPTQVVAGSMMRAYIRFEHEFTAADAATGQPYPASTVSSIPGGYQLCASDGSGCDDFTAFTTNTAGRITGFSVNGQPVAGRIATGARSSIHGLVVSDVIAYRLTGSQNLVAVTFRVHDISYRPVNNDPAALATFDTPTGHLSEDDSVSALPSSLSPGETVDGYAAFDTTQITGKFELRSNDGYDLLLASSVIHKA